MSILFINIVFLVFTLFIFGKLISYSLYEIKNEENFFGGVCVIVFSFLSIAFSNFVVWKG